MPAVGTEVAQQSIDTGIGPEYQRGNVKDATERNEWRGSSDAASAREGMISKCNMNAGWCWSRVGRMRG